MKKRIISLFSGAGGFDIGMADAGFETAVLVEIDPSCCDTLRANLPDVPVIEGDIREVTTKIILKTANLKPLEASLVIGGPPCQSFSLAGKREGLNDSRGMLVMEFARVVAEALPVAFVMENVRGMVNWDKGRAMKMILDVFKKPVRYQGNEYYYLSLIHI